MDGGRSGIAGADNGFELWRRLYYEKKGGTAITHGAGLTRFMELGKCRGWVPSQKPEGGVYGYATDVRAAPRPSLRAVA